jgi:formate hydrogenlyase transcriptional activator
MDKHVFSHPDAALSLESTPWSDAPSAPLEVLGSQGLIHRAVSDVDALDRRRIEDLWSIDEIVGASPALKDVFAKVDQVAPTNCPVLLLGETGTGKEMIARKIHGRSRRVDRPLVTVNCAALPAGLVESELFGYEKGAFTGALRTTLGRFDLAKGGTILLDEIGELPMELQPKLLRVLQSGEFQRLGGGRTSRVDVRIVASTNRDLGRDVAEGRFRADLFYRLSVFPIVLPPLRDRPGDVRLLVRHFIKRKQAQFGKNVKHVPEEFLRSLESYSWPGNVRELENVIERALILTEGPTLATDWVRPSRPEPTETSLSTLEEVERRHICAVLAACDWKVAGKGNAAERLGLRRSTLQFRMRKLGISRPPQS